MRIPSGARRALSCALVWALTAAGLYVTFHTPAPAPAAAVAYNERVTLGGARGGGQEAYISRETLLCGRLLLADAAHPLPGDYPAPNTFTLDAMFGQYVQNDGGVRLHRDTLYALCELATENPLRHAYVTVGARTRAQQTQARNDAYAAFCGYLPIDEALVCARAAVPDHGACEHQTPYAFDVRLTGTRDYAYADALRQTEDGRWLHEHAWRFGFIRRYPNAAVRAGDSRGLHFRYVGKHEAALLHALDASLEDFLLLLQTHGAVSLARDDAPDILALYAPLDKNGGAHFTLPPYADISYSLDNMGGAVAVLALP